MNASRQSRHGARCRVAIVFVTAVSACGPGLSLDPTGNTHHPESLEAGSPPKDAAGDTGDGAARDADVDRANDRSVAQDVVNEDANTGDRDPSPDSNDAEDSLGDASAPAGGDSALHDVTIEVGGEESSDADRDVEADARDVAIDPTSEADHADVMADATDGAPDICATCMEPNADYYVDATAPSGGDGSRAKPFTTITQAILAHAGSPLPKKAYVRAGTYDDALGETFPLELRGLSVQGAGTDRTFIVGAGPFDHTSAGGPMNAKYLVTIAAGDPTRPTDISHLTVRSRSPVPVENSYGIFCDRGNAPNEAQDPEGRLRLHAIVAGPGYDTTVLTTSSEQPAISGCNVVVTSSTLTGGWFGVRASDCELDPNRVPLIVEMGGIEPAMGNVVSWMLHPSSVTMGARLNECVKRGLVRHTSFVDGSTGIQIADSGDPATSPHFTVSHNVFERLRNFGVEIRGNGNRVVVDELSDNRFVAVSTTEPSPTLLVAGLNANFRQVGRLRRNQFIGNDIGAYFQLPPAGGFVADLGTASDPGNNVFRCNAGVSDGGGDVIIGSFDPSQPWVGVLHLAGNAWDHAPPTVFPAAPIPMGADLVIQPVWNPPSVTFDVEGSSVAPQPCPSGRVEGPN